MSYILRATPLAVVFRCSETSITYTPTAISSPSPPSIMSDIEDEILLNSGDAVEDAEEQQEKQPSKSRRRDYDDDEGEDEEEDEDDEEDDDEDEGGHSPKGKKRARVNVDGDSRPTGGGSKSEKRGQTLPRDEDGYVHCLAFHRIY